ncbi:leucine--tRNA ligase [uncultured Levyella sp.]|uniref:leucine--tRNA ligase n=1 Tax=uncultured Levyella sp. TaxID=1715800 RepID=UPI002585E0E3|nr:leucine--tRNA ligase [uncultured Levyella sp.]
METYNPAVIEKKWQEFWRKTDVFHATLDPSKKKYYALVEFPYPSGQGLHVGHPRPYMALDIVSRKRRLQGYNVLYPMGFDAFGLPTENYAIKHKIHPAEVTRKNIKHFRDQLDSIGFSFDWDRVINTTDPDYYRWTQWIFIQMVKHGLAYKKEVPINWCPSCRVGLSNEEVVNGACERCGTAVEHRVKDQWMLKITAYADRLIDDLDTVDYTPRIKQQQINWIGRSHGAEADFAVVAGDKETEDVLTVYTTRPDTMFGVTYMVVAPEHPMLEQYADAIENMDEIKAYQQQALLKSDFERGELNKDKTGVALKGVCAVNPANGKRIPIWVSDYVLMTYGTGAIMAVPAHDSRDWEFAKKFDLPIVEVVAGAPVPVEEAAFTDVSEGTLVNSDFLNGLSVKDAIAKMIAFLTEKHLGKPQTNYKLRDWVFSRQRYWGEPIPMVYCEEHGWQPIPEEQLPLLLPEVPNYQPTATGESPLAEMEDFVNTTCPICGKPARRETDTMPQWAGSSWYYLRYMDPHNNQELVSKEAEQYFGPVDWYNGGMEHTTLHLLYSRFWHKFLYDIGVVSTKEPYAKRTSHGMIMGDNGEKMSKSRGNVVNPDEIVSEYGADTLRTYEMFIGDFEKSANWTESGVQGCRKFLERVWKMADLLTEDESMDKETEVLFHQSIKKVTEDFETLKFNTAIAQLMTLSNALRAKERVTRTEWKTFLLLLNPVAPHVTEELWERAGFTGHIATDGTWPEYQDDKLSENYAEMPIQINGKVRGKVVLPLKATQEQAVEAAQKEESIARYLEGKKLVKVIFVPNKILNLVVK